MAKKKIRQREAKPAAQPKDRPSFIDRHPLGFLLIIALVSLTIFYFPVLFGGKSLVSPDKLTSNAIKPFINSAFDRGIFPMWTPYVFSGMPSFASLMSAPRVNLIDSAAREILRALSFILPEPDFIFNFLNYLVFAVLMYALMRSKKISPIASLFSAVAVIFIPQFIAFTAYGHNTKFLSLSLIPLIILLTMKLLEEKKLLYFCLTALAIGFQTIRAHTQVTYYTFLLLGVYLLFHIGNEIRAKKSFSQISAAIGLLAGAIVLGVALSSALYLPVYEYQKFSIRGGAEGGLDFEYASNWSFHPVEMITFFIPSFVGFGGETYWGKMPFTDYPLYFGITVLFLSGIAFLLRRDKWTWLFGLTAVFSLLVSFGRHFGLLYTPMFNFLPFFNKFRVPSMIHILLDIAMVVLAGFGLQALMDLMTNSQKNAEALRKRIVKYMTIFAVGLVFLVFLLIIGRSVYLDLVIDARQNLNVDQRELAYDGALKDGFIILAILAAAIVLVAQFLKAKLSARTFGLCFVGLVVVDLWLVDFRIIHPQPRTEEKAYFAPNNAVNLIKQDKGLYRIYPVLDDKNANWYMYHFVQSIYGYSAAKIRIYQDFLEESGIGSQDQYGLVPFISKYWRYAVRENRPTFVPVPVQQIDPKRLAFDAAMLDMLNVKYLINSYLPITDPRFRQLNQDQPWVYENTTVMPRAFFVDSIEVLPGRRAIFDRMKDGTFDPRKVAILEAKPALNVEPDETRSVNIKSWDIQDIKLEATATKPSLLVLSEVYYPAGWKAFVNGVETPIYKTNYILRSILLQPGRHQIEFKYQSKAFHTGVWISLVILMLLLSTILTLLYLQYTSRRKTPAPGDQIQKQAAR